MAKQTFTTGQVLTAAQVNALQTNDFNQTVSAKTASYILVAADKGTRIEFNTSGSVTCTVNTGLFDAGDTVYIQNTGAGVVTITAGTATVNTSANLTINQYEGGVLYFVSASSAIWFEYASTATGDITGITTGATSGLTGGVTSGTADLKLNTTAKGGLLVGTGSGTSSELAVGTNGQILTADSTTATGLKWAAAAGGGKVLQVVNAIYSTETIVASTTYTDTGLTASITPSSTTSKILVTISQPSYNNRSTSPQGLGLRIMRGATAILSLDASNLVAFGLRAANDGVPLTRIGGVISYTYLDSPSTTSSTTYKTQGQTYDTTSGGTAYFNTANSVSSITLMEIGA